MLYDVTTTSNESSPNGNSVDVAHPGRRPLAELGQVAFGRGDHIGRQVDPGEPQIGSALGQFDQQHAGAGADIEHLGTLRDGVHQVVGDPAVQAAQRPAGQEVVDTARAPSKKAGRFP